MNHTKYLNERKDKTKDVIAWLLKNIEGIKNKPITVGMNYDQTVRIIEVSKKLSTAEKKKLIEKYPELANKEIE